MSDDMWGTGADVDVEWLEGDAEALSFGEDSCDPVISAIVRETYLRWVHDVNEADDGTLRFAASTSSPSSDDKPPA